MEIRASDHVVLVRQAVRKWAIELGFSLVDQTKMITAASELARNTLDYGGGGTVRLEALEEGHRQGPAADLRGPRAGHPRHREGAHRRLHDREGDGHGAERLEAAGQRVRDRLAGRRGHPGHDHEVEVITTSGRPIVLAIDDADHGRRGPASGDGTGRSARLRRDGAREGRHRRHRGGDEPRQARDGRRDRHPGSGVRDDRRGRSPGPGPRARAWRTSIAAWPTASPPPGRRAPGWARWPACRPSSTSIRSPGSGRRRWPGSGRRRGPSVRGLSAWSSGPSAFPLAGEEVCGDAWAIDGSRGSDPRPRGRRAGARPAGGGGRPGGRPGLPGDGAARPGRDHPGGPRRARGAPAVPPSRSPGSTANAAKSDSPGVGNIAGAILGPAESRSTSMVSHNGTVGHTIRKIQEFTYPWAPGRCWSCTPTAWAPTGNWAVMPGWRRDIPGWSPGLLYRDFKRGRDDVTVVAVREGSASRR